MGEGKLLDIGKALSRAFDVFGKNAGVLIVAGILALLLSSISFGILIGPLAAGLVFIGLKLLRGQPAEIGDVFKKFEKFGPTFLLCLLVCAAYFGVWLATFILAFIPFIGPVITFLVWLAISVASPLIAAFVFFAICGMVEKDLNLSEAIKDSIARIKVKPLECWLLSLVLVVIGSICAIITLPIAIVGFVVIYTEGTGVTTVQSGVSV